MLVLVITDFECFRKSDSNLQEVSDLQNCEMKKNFIFGLEFDIPLFPLCLCTI